MEPYYRNIISGEDDNVETLTGNADGNDVGMEYPAAREQIILHLNLTWHGEDVLQSTNLRIFVKWWKS